MNIDVRLYATLRQHQPEAPAGVLSAELPEGASVRALMEKLGIDPAEVHILMVNGASSPVDQVLKDGDRVGLFPPVGGG